MSEHTPGPWHCAKRRPRQISDKRGFKVAKCLISTKGANFELPIEEVEANARLIAAAPEMLEALIEARPHVEAALKALKPGSSCHARLKEKLTHIDAAISKAKEGQ